MKNVKTKNLAKPKARLHPIFKTSQNTESFKTNITNYAKSL